MTTFDKQETKEAEVKTEPVVQPLAKPPESKAFTDPELRNQAWELATMLGFCRPDKSKAEAKFIAKYLVPLGVTFDKRGNIYKTIGENPVVLWSCHTDTVHNKQGQQKIEYIFHKTTGEMFLQTATSPKTDCLGADDTVGVWLMIQMIKANIPGLYIFHRAEEVGGKGSAWVADKNKDALKGIKYAIAFDRKGEKSIITYQRSKRCCSDEFAKSLADQLGMSHECDTGGSFTDTASYVDLVPECTNISSGYINAHCWDEATNVDYLFRLRDSLLKLDVSKLVEKRKAGENESLYKSYTYSGGSYEGNYYGREHWDDWAWDQSNSYYQKSHAKDSKKKIEGYTWLELTKKHKGQYWKSLYKWNVEHGFWVPKARKTDLGVTKTMATEDKRSKPTFRDAVRLVRLNPEIVADLLDTCGYDPQRLQDYLLDENKFGFTVML